MEVLLRTHGWIVDEMQTRGLAHRGVCPFARKIRTSFGDFSRPLEIKNFPAVRLPEAEAKRLIDGKISFLSVPWTAEAASILGKLGDGRLTILTGQTAVGTAQIRGDFGGSRNAPDLTAVASGSASEFRSAIIRFFPLVGPVRVKAPAGGVIAAGVVDPEQTALEKQVDVETTDITPAFLEGVTDAQIEELAVLLRDRARPFLVQNTEPEDLVNAFIFLAAEADKRGLEIGTDDPLDQAAARLGKADPPGPEVDVEKVDFIHRNLPERLVVIPNFVSITGSTIYSHPGGEPPDDLDVVYRCSKDSLGLGGLTLKLERALKMIAGGVPINHIANPEGPALAHLPAFDLVLVRRPEAKIEDA